MKKFTPAVIISFFLLVHTVCSAQTGLDKMKEITSALKQDTTKSKAKPGTQSNLAVSDEGAGGGKGKSQTKKTTDNTTAPQKGATQNNPPSDGSSGQGGSNLAVSDEGKGGSKGNTSKRETVADSTNATPSPLKEGVAPKQ